MDQYNKMPPAVQQVFDSLVGDKMLFGSRSMASRWATDNFNPAVKIGSKITPSTDYDIAAEFNEDNCRILLQAGFKSTKGDVLYSKDDLTEMICTADMVDGSADIFEQIVTVHVVLRKQNSFFMTVWDSIDAEYYYEHLWKRGPKFANNRHYTTHKDKMKKEIRDAMNQLYSSAGFNMQSNNKLVVEFGGVNW